MTDLADIFSEGIRTPKGHADMLITSSPEAKDNRPVLQFSLTATGKRVIVRSDDEG